MWKFNKPVKSVKMLTKKKTMTKTMMQVMGIRHQMVED